VAKSAWIADTLMAEKVTLGLSQDEIAKGNVVDSAAEVHQATDIVREDRQKIAPTYT
jgi:hypothetical protein